VVVVVEDVAVDDDSAVEAGCRVKLPDAIERAHPCA
jgi:hypothetical protein